MSTSTDLVVRAARTHHLSLPLPRHYVSGIHDYRATENVLLELDVGDAVGVGYAFAFLPGHARAIREIVCDLAETLVGREVDDVRAIWTELWRRLDFVGQTGLATIALGAVDMALWDLLGKRAGLPLHSLLGSVGDTLPVYASGGWFTCDKDELVEEAREFAAAGYAGYKIKIGHADPRIDLDRVEHLLARVEGEIDVMVDVNQAWSREQAIAAGRELQALGVTWIEEPVASRDIESSRRVREGLEIPVAAGESVFTRDGFARLIEGEGADVLMPNVARCGGPSQFMVVAALADANHLPISSHTYTEVSAQLMAASPNAGLVEYIPGWWDALFDEAPRVRDGAIALPDAPGLGITFSERAIAECSVDSAVPA
jgi:L-alanine-DL-glutamate epimerase-like enolase superfamily enzyme